MFYDKSDSQKRVKLRIGTVTYADILNHGFIFV